jgi:hypothetical protein
LPTSASTLDAQTVVRHSGRDDDRLRPDSPPAGQRHDFLGLVLGQTADTAGHDELRAQRDRLLVRVTGELRPADTPREAEVVADHRARPRLAANGLMFDHHGSEAF